LDGWHKQNLTARLVFEKGGRVLHNNDKRLLETDSDAMPMTFSRGGG
jgi:hypothetical protein